MALEAEKKKVVIVTNIPNPYRIPFFNVVNRILSESSLGLYVIFASRTYRRRRWTLDLGEMEFYYLFLEDNFGISSKELCKGTFKYSGLLKTLKRLDPYVVVSGGFHPGAIKSAFFCTKKKIKFVIWSGSIITRQRNYGFFRTIQRMILIRLADSFIAYGTHAKDYLVKYGAPAKKVSIAINSTDIDFFSLEASRFRERKNSSENNRLNLLLVGNLEPKKRVDIILNLMAHLYKKGLNAKLTIIGTGSQESELKTVSRELNVEEYIEWVGFKPWKEIPSYFATSDCFLFPSEYDVWGLVLNEAMASGLPCIASIHAGATRDLIQDGETGFAVDFRQTDLVIKKLKWIMDHPKEARQMGDNAARFVREHASLEISARAFCRALVGS